MNTEDLDRILKHTLTDHRLSRGERNVLGKTVTEMTDHDPHKLSVVRSRAFEIARQELMGPDAIAVLGWLEDVIKVMATPGTKEPTRSEVFFSPDDDCVGRICGMLATARNTVDICVFTITDDRITDAIADTFHRRVKIRIISDNDKAFDVGSDIDRLRRLGIPLTTDRSSDHMHHKYAVFDQTTLLTGSYNWTRSASNYNQENFLVTDEPQLVRRYLDHFERLWDQLADI